MEPERDDEPQRAQEWRAGAQANSRLGARLFSLGGSVARATGLGSAALLLLGGAAFVFVGRAVDSDGDGAAGGGWVALAVWVLVPAGIWFAWWTLREVRGSLVVWEGALELATRGRRRFWPWKLARAWRRAGEFEVVVDFARGEGEGGNSIVVDCESQAQREAIVTCLIAADARHDPWLDDPRRAR